MDDDSPSEILKYLVGGVPTSLVVDSGFLANIIRENTYRKLQRNCSKNINEREKNLNLEAFTSNEKILIRAALEAEIRTPKDENAVWAHFLAAPKVQTESCGINHQLRGFPFKREDMVQYGI